MNLLEQCQKWNENNEFQKIITALENVPSEKRTPEMDSELARAYNNLANPEDQELFIKAIALLKPLGLFPRRPLLEFPHGLRLLLPESRRPCPEIF